MPQGVNHCGETAQPAPESLGNQNPVTRYHQSVMSSGKFVIDQQMLPTDERQWSM
jgi:hypothetical protein